MNVPFTFCNKQPKHTRTDVTVCVYYYRTYYKAVLGTEFFRDFYQFVDSFVGV